MKPRWPNFRTRCWVSWSPHLTSSYTLLMGIKSKKSFGCICQALLLYWRWIPSKPPMRASPASVSFHLNSDVCIMNSKSCVNSFGLNWSHGLKSMISSMLILIVLLQSSILLIFDWLVPVWFWLWITRFPITLPLECWIWEIDSWILAMDIVQSLEGVVYWGNAFLPRL